MQLASMKLDPKDEEETKDVLYGGSDPDKPEYPYGLRICLDEEQIKKLGLATMPEAGSVLTLSAKVKVASVRSNDTQDEGTERGMDLQITDLGIGS